jgi:hypothetical protein
MYISRNTEARSRNYCYRGKGKSIIYSQCVSVAFFCLVKKSSRRYGRTADLRLLVQPYDENDYDDYFLSFSK